MRRWLVSTRARSSPFPRSPTRPTGTDTRPRAARCPASSQAPSRLPGTTSGRTPRRRKLLQRREQAKKADISGPRRRARAGSAGQPKIGEAVQFDFERMAALERYRLLLETVLPRPIAWVTTRDAAGAINAAPFSFFNVFGSDPAAVGIGIGSKGPAEPKDTRANIRTNEQFVVNLVPFTLAEQMRVTSIAFP